MQHPANFFELAAKYRLAYMSGRRETTVEALVSISSSWLALYERAASYVDIRPEATFWSAFHTNRSRTRRPGGST
jgi:hypothetical protein